MHCQHAATFLLFTALALPLSRAQDPVPAKGPDKEVADRIATLKEVVADKKFLRDGEGVQAIDVLLQKIQAGVDPKDAQAILKALDGALNSGKLRPHDKTELYVGAATALGMMGGADAAKVLKSAFDSKRFPNKPDWVRLREQLLRNLGRTKDESMVKFLVDEARNNTEAALQAAAGEALGNFEESKEAVRKEIVSGLLNKYGELDQKASEPGSNMQAQEAQDRLAALADKWNTTLAKLTRQNFSTFAEWQSWHNKNKGQAW